MQCVILAHLEDETALRVAGALRTRHAADVRTLSARELALAPRWRHRLDGPATTTELRLSDGATLDSARLGCVFNRLVRVELPHFARAAPEDQTYAAAETYAFWLSWLASLPCPVVNPATPRGLGLQERSHIEWLTLAGKAGLTARGFHFVSDPRRYPERRYPPHERLAATAPDGAPIYQPVPLVAAARRPTFFLEEVAPERRHALIAGAAVLGAPDPALREPLRRLAALAGCDLLRVSFARSAPGAWKVCTVSSFPHAADAGEVAAIAALLAERATAAEVQR